MAPDDSWAELADKFVGGHYGSLRGRVRTHVIDRQLRWHLPPPPAELVDIGGGAGHQALPLARDGYRVTLVDPSPTMLQRAHGQIAAEADEVAARIRLVEGSGETAPELLDGQRFAGVLCHGVLMYLEKPEAMVAALAELAAPGAIVSVVAKNARTLAARPALAGDWEAALAAFDADRQVNGLGLDTRGDTVEDLEALLQAQRLNPVAWYGVRLFTDGWAQNLPSEDATDDLLAVELEASRRDPYRQLSRLFHLVAKRPGRPAAE